MSFAWPVHVSSCLATVLTRSRRVLVCSLIGTSLIGKSGVLNWGGGSNCHGSPEGFFALCPNIAAPRPAAFGSPRMIGLGFASFVTIILVSAGILLRQPETSALIETLFVPAWHARPSSLAARS